MTAEYTEFYDIIGANFDNVPLVAGNYVAVYVTGSGPVPETAAQIAAAKAAGMGVLTIDQTPGLVLFRQGKADFGDIEYLAGTDVSAASAIAERQALGLTEHGLYVAQDSWAQLKADVADAAGVVYWIANWSDSEMTAEEFIAANSDVRAVQFGDPASNPRTTIPGTDIPLSQANADIDVASTAWLAQFLPAAPAPAPAPSPAPSPSPTDPTEAIVQQLPLVKKGDTGPAVGRVQALLLANLPGVNLGTDGPHHDGIDEVAGDLTDAAIRQFQVAHGLTDDGEVGTQETWPALLGV